MEGGQAGVFFRAEGDLQHVDTRLLLLPSVVLLAVNQGNAVCRFKVHRSTRLLVVLGDNFARL